MARFDSAIALVKRLIEKNGETATIRRPVDGSPPDASKPWEPGAATASDQTPSMVFLDQKAARDVGVLIKDREQAAFVPASDLGSFVPDASTDIVIRASGEKWSIVRVDTLSPNGQLIMHTLILEK